VSEISRPAAAPPPAQVPRDRPSTGRHGRVSLGWTELVVGAVAYLILSAGIGLGVIALTGATPGPVATLVVVGVATLAALAVALQLRVRSAAAVGVRTTSWRWLLLGVAAGLLCYVLNRGVILAYVAITNDASNPQQSLAPAAGGPSIALVGTLLAGAVLVPIAEELLFRGIGYGALRRYGVVVATVLSAVIFGLAHGINVVLPATILIGVVNALLYERSRSIWPSVVAHGTNNALAFSLAALLT
jgi:uncharacterized protein